MTDNSKIIVNKYRERLFNDIIKKSDSVNLLPLVNEEDIKKTTDIEYFRSMFHSFLNHLAFLNLPIYNCRQEFLEYAFLNADDQVCFHLDVTGSDSTCMGGECEDDPFYNPNWKTCVYSNSEQYISRIINNLTSRFYRGVNSNFYNFNARDSYIKTISLNDISIERFNLLFTPVMTSNKEERDLYFTKFKLEIADFLKEIVIFEDFEDSTKSKDIEKFKTDTENEKYTNIARSFSREFLDEKGNLIDGRPANLGWNSIIEVGDIVIFVREEQRIITSIKILNNPLDGAYLQISTKLINCEKYKYWGF